MKLIGAAVNCRAVFLGSLLGLLFKKGIPERVQKSLNYALSLCVLYIGIKGSLKGENTLIAALSLAIGTIIGELIDIDRHLNKFGDFFAKEAEPQYRKFIVRRGLCKCHAFYLRRCYGNSRRD